MSALGHLAQIPVHLGGVCHRFPPLYVLARQLAEVFAPGLVARLRNLVNLGQEIVWD
jgi:hypothetical protein